MFRLADQAHNATEPVPVDLTHSVHEAMAESMLLLIIGEVGYCCHVKVSIYLINTSLERARPRTHRSRY